MPHFEFTREEIHERYVTIGVLASQFVDALATRTGIDNFIWLNERKLFLALQSALQDVARYKAYHQERPLEQKSDAIKRSAFMIKWLMRFKPVELGSKSDDRIEDSNIDTLILANAMFALTTAEANLSADAGAEFEYTPEKKYDLAYDLVYRDIGADGWMAILQLTMEGVKGLTTPGGTSVSIRLL